MQHTGHNALTATLSNGLRVRLYPQPHLKTAEFGLYVNAGPRFESAEDNGISHFTEHMLFRGTQGYTTQALHSAVEMVGGPVMALTGRDYCLYYLQLPQRHLASAIPLLADICIKPTFQQLEIERPIILEELLEDQNENGKDICPENHARAMQWPLSSLSQTILGSKDNIEAISESRLHAHHKKHYCAHNCLLYISGPSDLEQWLPLIETHFGQMAPGLALPRPTVSKTSTGPKCHIVENDGSQNTLSLSFHAPALGEAEHTAMDLLNITLSDGMTSRLQWALCETLGLVYDLEAVYECYSDVASYDISAACTPSKSAQVLQALRDTFKDLKEKGLGTEELLKIKERYYIALEMAQDSPGAVANQVARAHLYGIAPDINENLRRVEQHTSESLKALSQRIFTPANLTFVVVGRVDKALRKQLGDLINGPW